MMMFETSKHVPKTEKRCCVFENNRFICANKTICVFERPFKVQKNGVFLFEFIFFRFRDIDVFLLCKLDFLLNF